MRLPLEVYGIPGSVWHVTISTEDRIPVLAVPRVAQIVVDELRRQTSFRDATLLLFCVMPDHVHAVIQVGAVDLISIVRSFKAYASSRCSEEGLLSKFWQARFHDRGIRESDDMDVLVAYILKTR